jgi:hypothetical protein
MKEVALVSSVPMQADSARGNSNIARTFAGIPKCNLSLGVTARGRFYPLGERKETRKFAAVHRRHRPAATGKSLASRLSADDAVGAMWNDRVQQVRDQLRLIAGLAIVAGFAATFLWWR